VLELPEQDKEPTSLGKEDVQESHEIKVVKNQGSVTIENIDLLNNHQ
jgi:hypothetical protein